MVLQRHAKSVGVFITGRRKENKIASIMQPMKTEYTADNLMTVCNDFYHTTYVYDHYFIVYFVLIMFHLYHCFFVVSTTAVDRLLDAC